MMIPQTPNCQTRGPVASTISYCLPKKKNKVLIMIRQTQNWKHTGNSSDCLSRNKKKVTNIDSSDTNLEISYNSCEYEFVLSSFQAVSNQLSSTKSYRLFRNKMDWRFPNA